MGAFLTTSAKVVRECAEAMAARRETTQTYDTKDGARTAKGRVTAIREVDRMSNGSPIWEITIEPMKRAMRVVEGGQATREV